MSIKKWRWSCLFLGLKKNFNSSYKPFPSPSNNILSLLFFSLASITILLFCLLFFPAVLPVLAVFYMADKYLK